MKCHQSEYNGFTVLNFSEEIDLNSSPEVRQIFDECINKKIIKFIVNFQDVTYVDSSGLATLIEMMQRLKKNQGTMYLVGMSEKINNLFEITKLSKLFKIYPTKEEAVSQES